MLFFNFSSTEYIIGLSKVKIDFFSFVEILYANKVSALMYKQNNPLLSKQTAYNPQNEALLNLETKRMQK